MADRTPSPAVTLGAAVLGVAMVLSGLWQLQSHRSHISTTSMTVGGNTATPVTVYRRAVSEAEMAPAVIIAHGFAGSRQLMEAYALTLARSGYVVASFDFEGHGRNPTPMSGDVSSVEGTTRILMEETSRVVEAVLALPDVDGRHALLGHSMASDIIIRQAIADGRAAAVVSISTYSEAITSDEPPNLLLITGEWESSLRAEALRAARLADPAASEGHTTGAPSAGDGRRIVVAPNVEHVGVLYSTTALTEARDWLNAVFDQSSRPPVAATGPAIVLLLAGLLLLGRPLAHLLPQGRNPPAAIPRRTFALAVAVPAVITPLALRPFDTNWLAVLVADYVALHMLVYGTIALGLLRLRGVRIGPVAWGTALAIALFGVFVFGGALDRYVASFMPNLARLEIITAIAVGAVPLMLADSVLCEAGKASALRVLIVRCSFVASLLVAVALDVDNLMFLAIIVPVIALFFVVFGTLGGLVGRRTRSPGAIGIGLGVVLAWAIGVSFPLFAS